VGVIRRAALSLAIAVVALPPGWAVADPDDDRAQPGAGDPDGSSAQPGSADPGGSSAQPGSVDPGGSSAQPGSVDPGGSSALGSADPDGGSAPGSADPDGGSAQPGSAGSGAGSGAGSDTGKVIQLPVTVGAPDVRAAASPSVVRLGGRFTLYVTATFGSGVEVNLREPLDLGPAFEVRRRLSEDRPSSTGGTTREWQLEVTPWELGDGHIAPIAVTFTVFGRAGQVQTNAVPMKIVGVLGEVVDDPKLMRGLAAPAPLTMRDWFWIWFTTALGAATAVRGAALGWRRRRRRRTLRLVGAAIARPRRIDMTGERALERLLAIEQAGVLERDAERKAGYAEMVEVIRDYLAARYRTAIHDLTSSELLRRLDELAPHDEVELVAAWLDDCDLVKYSGGRATPAEAGKALDDARALIVTTTQLRAAARSAAAKDAA
jgi:hypothetical protein